MIREHRLQVPSAVKDRAIIRVGCADLRLRIGVSQTPSILHTYYGCVPFYMQISDDLVCLFGSNSASINVCIAEIECTLFEMLIFPFRTVSYNLLYQRRNAITEGFVGNAAIRVVVFTSRQNWVNLQPLIKPLAKFGSCLLLPRLIRRALDENVVSPHYLFNSL
jgi:hypothetical protein